MSGKRCPDCGHTRPLDEFHKHPSGTQGVCKMCMRKRMRTVMWRRQGIGIEFDTYSQMVAARGGCCDICGEASTTRDLAVDHDKVSKEIRGLLCVRCNTALGKFNHDTATLLRAIDYLSGRGGTA